MKNRDIYSYMLRKYKFAKFNKKHIKFSEFVLANNSADDKLKDSYDCFVCGSDQIWNPLFKFIYEDIENSFAMFADRKQRLSYAGSFGISEIPKEFEKQYKELVNGLYNVVVR